MSIVTATRLAELLGSWRGAGPANQRLAATVRSLLLDGRIPLDNRLPPERELARVLGTSRATVTAAYDVLRADGYLTSRMGAGSWSTAPAGHAPAADSVSHVDGLDLRIAATAAPPMLEELACEAAAELPRWLGHHGYDPLGLPPLRAAIAQRLTERGLPTGSEQVIVTAGALHALDLAARALTRRAGEALVEIPSYPAALDLLRGAGLRLRTIPTTHEGWDLDALAGVASRARPQLAYLIPDFQNPTGALVDTRSRERALELLAGHQTYVVIDETFVELQLDRLHTPPPMASLASGARTITIGSLSKSVWGGLRIGWARADPALIQRLGGARATSDIASPVLDQLLAVRVLDRLQQIMPPRRELLRRSRAALTAALERHLPDWSFHLPAGGQFVWVQLPGAFSTSLAVSAAEHGLHIAPGSRFAGAGLLERYLRLPFTLPSDQLERAIAILAELTPGAECSTPDPREAFVA